MKQGDIVAGLDLGSTKTCAVIAQITGDERVAGVKILGVGVCRETGVRAGLVRDIEETTRSIVAAMEDARRMAGVPVPPVYCGIAGNHVQLRTSPGLVSVTGEEIDRSDVARVGEVATAITLGQDRELLHSIPQDYKVDDQDGISDPIGFSGTRLEVEMYLVSVLSSAAQNVRKSVDRAGYDLNQLVFEPLASSTAVLTAEERELGCALIDMGGASTSVAIMRDGRIRHIASLPHAGDRITGDIVHGLSVTQAQAEQIKEQYGFAYTPMVDPEDEFELPSTPAQGNRHAKKELLSHIIHARLDEVLGLVRTEIESSGYAGHLPAGVVLTGGTGQARGLVELAREVFAMPARVGAPTRGVSGLVDSVNAPRYAVPVGLVYYAAEEGLKAGAGRGVQRVIGRARKWLQDFF